MATVTLKELAARMNRLEDDVRQLREADLVASIRREIDLLDAGHVGEPARDVFSRLRKKYSIPTSKPSSRRSK